MENKNASKNDSNTTSSPTPGTHDEQTGHDELSRKAHVSGKETVGETTQEIINRKGLNEDGTAKSGDGSTGHAAGHVQVGVPKEVTNKP